MVVQDAGGRDPNAPRVVLAPLNLAFGLPPDLEDAVDPVEEGLRRYWTARGARVALIWPPSDARALWHKSVGRIDRIGDTSRDLRAAVAEYAAAIERQTPFDLLLLPSLVYREAEVVRGVASWDGVRRRIGVREDQGTGKGPDISPGEPVFGSEGIAAAPEWGGSMAALSLHVVVWNATTGRQTQRWGGLDLVHDAVLAGGTQASPEPDLRLRADPLGEADNVREGIAIALDAVRLPAAARRAPVPR